MRKCHTRVYLDPGYFEGDVTYVSTAPYAKVRRLNRNRQLVLDGISIAVAYERWGNYGDALHYLDWVLRRGVTKRDRREILRSMDVMRKKILHERAENLASMRYARRANAQAGWEKIEGALYA